MNPSFEIFTPSPTRAAWFTPGRASFSSFKGGTFRLRLCSADPAPVSESAAGSDPRSGAVGGPLSGAASQPNGLDVLCVEWRRISRGKNNAKETTPKPKTTIE
jgi:hypothetical protein